MAGALRLGVDVPDIERGLDVRRGAWSGEQETLSSGTAQLDESRGRQLGFHSLGDRLQSEGSGQADDRPDDGQVVDADSQVADEPSVNFQDVHREGLELGVGTVTGAEIVNGDLHTDFLETAQGGQGLLRVAHQGLLGDLQCQVPAVQAGGGENLADRGHEIQGDQLGGGDVDTQTERTQRIFSVPLLELGASGFDHPTAQLPGEVGGLGDVDESTGLQYPQRGVRPPDQGLEAENPSADEIHLGLIVQDKGSVPDSGPEMEFDVGADLVRPPHFRGEDGDRVAAVPL